MNRLFFSLLAAASLTLPMAAVAQAQAPAPIERPHYRGEAGGTRHAGPTHVLQPAEGVQVLTDGKVETVSNTAGRLELRLVQGRANVSVNNPADGTMILIDVPGGQADLIKDGFYTLNAQTNTLSVLHGEAVAFAPNAPADAEGHTVKEMQGAVLGEHIHPDDLYEAQAQADILQGPPGSQQQYADRNGGGYGDQGYGDGGYGYGDGYAAGYGYPGYGYGYGSPYYAGYYGYGGYPWGWDAGWGYPVFGLGFGYGGYYGGGYYGGYRGGYRGLPGHYGYNPGRNGFSSGGIHGYSGGGVSHGGFSSGGSSHGGFSGGSHGSSGGGSHR